MSVTIAPRQTAANAEPHRAAPRFLGVGLAMMMTDPEVVEILSERYASGELGYYEFYFDGSPKANDYFSEFRSRLPAGMPTVWHCGGEFELLVPNHDYARYGAHFRRARDVWQPEWALEDFAAITFNFTSELPSQSVGLIPPPLTEKALDVVVRNTRRARELCPIDFIPEMPYFPVPVRHDMDLSAFMTALADRAECELVFDVGHYMSFNLLHGKPHDEGLDRFPWSKVREFHIGGGFIGDAAGRVWVDHHASPVHPMQLEILRRVLPRCTNLRGILLELIDVDRTIVEYSLALLDRHCGDAIARHRARMGELA